jgi:integrase
MALTDLTVRKLPSKSERFEVLDGNGLYIRVMPTGKKSWVFRYNFEGSPRRMTIGSYPGYTLAEAREKHAKAVQDVQKGIDPGLKAKQEKAKRKAAPTFADLLDEFWEVELQFKPTGKARKRLVEKDALPSWGKRKVTSITRRDAVLLLDDVRKRAPITANRLQGVLVRTFNFAAERGMIEHSPLSGMRRGKETARSRVLTDDEIKKLWKGLDLENKNIDAYRLTKLALKAILLTGQRPGEVAAMEWNQLDDEYWTIPEEKRKTGEANKIAICPMFAEVIEHAKIYSSDSKYVFRSTMHEDAKNKEAKSITRGSLAAAVLRHRAAMGVDEPFTPHDLRRTMRTRLAEIGISDIVAERVLGHKLQGVLGVYNRHSYDLEKRQAIGAWERKLSDILGPSGEKGNVIPFRGRNA